MSNTTEQEIEKEIRGGGKWLGKAREWMQWNISKGDSLEWGSNEPILIEFRKLEEFAKEVAIAAIKEDREKREKEEKMKETFKR